MPMSMSAFRFPFLSSSTKKARWHVPVFGTVVAIAMEEVAVTVIVTAVDALV
jgi:hypothetical protein